MTEIIESQWNKIRKHLDKEYKEDLVDMIISDMSDEAALALLDNIYILNGEKS